VPQCGTVVPDSLFMADFIPDRTKPEKRNGAFR